MAAPNRVKPRAACQVVGRQALTGSAGMVGRRQLPTYISTYPSTQNLVDLSHKYIPGEKSTSKYVGTLTYNTT